MTSSRSSQQFLGATGFCPSSLLKTLAVLGVFICVISYSYWGRLVSVSANFIHRESLPSSDIHFDNPTGQNWTNRIWQTSKLPVVAIGDEERQHIKTWSDLNPEYKHEVLTDEMMESYVKEHFHSSHPEIEQMYSEIKDYILRADLIRYLILLADGGVYNDLDVGCEKPIKNWVPPQYKDSGGILFGVEVDNERGPDGKTSKGGQDLFELVNWTIMSKPNQPFMWFLVKRVMNNIRNLAASQQQPISSLTCSVQSVLDVSGSSALTQAFYDYASSISESKVTYHNFTKITEPWLIGEVVILPIHAFSAGHQGGTPLVHHYFTGSWKTDHDDKVPQSPSIDDEQQVKEIDVTKAKEEAEKNEYEEQKKKQAAKTVHEAAKANEKEVTTGADGQQPSAIHVSNSLASSVISVQPSSKPLNATEEKPSNGQTAGEDSYEKAASDTPASVKYVEDQTEELNSSIEATAEPESMIDILAKAKAEKEAEAKALAEMETMKAAEAAKEKEMKEELAAKEAAEEKAKDDAKSDEEKEADAWKAKEHAEEEERKAKWEEVKKVAPKTAPKKTDEEKQKSSNDLTDYDYIPD